MFIPLYPKNTFSLLFTELISIVIVKNTIWGNKDHKDFEKNLLNIENFETNFKISN